MEFSTKVSITNNSWEVNVDDRILMLGSCFSTNMADKMKEYYLRVDSNPDGVLYNPISIARHMTESLVVKADVIIITFGTSWVYERNGVVVDNCQKKPASLFNRRRLTVADIVSVWRPILERCSKKRFIFTVSPIRHIKDGLHENQISKGILLQAVDELMYGMPTRVDYFPSYEILMDELRDYRFYADDMLHPSSSAITYLWERFRLRYMFAQTTADKMHELHQLWMNKNHQLLNPESDEAKAFVKKVEQEYTSLKRKYPWI